MKKIIDYNFPDDLKTMSLEEMELLSYGIRDFLIEKVSRTGGHLASNLGIVELTIALHKVFDSPKDKIIWDVGHQAYVHKILTGRADRFDTLRQFGGLSGFPKTCESDHDAFDTGHSSTSISVAAGMAAARDIKGEHNEVIAVIGDGSLTGGMAFEALNSIGDSKSKVIVILNDNGMSISPNVGGLSTHLDSLRTSESYLNVKKFIKNKVGAIPGAGKSIVAGLADFKNDIKYSIMDSGGVLFEELGFTYLGPVDGHDLEAVIADLERAKSLNEPVIVHVLTEKGKGYRNAERFPDKFHGIGPFDPETGDVLKKPSGPDYSSVMGSCLCRLAAEDDRIVAITAAMADGTGLTDFARKYPKRFFDVGIAEQNAVTFAAGLAKEGIKPVVPIYSSFLQRAYDQMLHDVCIQKLPVIFCLDRAGIVGADGETHQGLFDLAYLNTMPGMTIYAPTCSSELERALEEALKINGPVAIRYPRGTAAFHDDVYKPSQTNFEPSDVKKVGDNKFSGVTILAAGKMAEIGGIVAENLRKRDIITDFWPVWRIKPMDVSQIGTIPDDNLIVTIEDGILTGGFGQNITANTEVNRNNIMNIGWPDVFIPQGSFDELTVAYELDAASITERIVKTFEGKA